ncbi:ATP-dependent RNA helicase CHL1 [Suhomyces tanzawaensis NRRL Y-17324]|uniref:ATP-dependent DNA helicase CHL1 n=1 Tax=Suhomyces tanzawaensis NRRL Y-17324 TaxID=984487 RepID=A0A1E4SJU8_9ASCO|nr:ATP-dependent RNA helicase CHL1 [Suhomyces tanzawaensis NRRL Y-17324]ODV79712.1 ATP-dependent RNA helicase CHL1 [Suhomyces tanzawaensis NRRL Y-17324]
MTIDYSHPFTPYKIQEDLMDAIYDTIENNYKIGIFESPTGTGKTLSIICSSMTWLRNYKRKHKYDEVKQDDSDEDEPQWVKNDYTSNILERSKSRIKDYEKYLDTLENELEQNVQTTHKLNAKSKRPKIKSEYNDEDFLPKNYQESEDIQDENSRIQNEINSLLGKINSDDVAVETEECPIRIFFTSRTHSQLNQFSHQLRLTKFHSSFDDVTERTKYLPFGSRKQLCINPKVRNVSKNDSNINDACIDLQGSKEGCEYLPKDYSNSSLMTRLSDLSLTKIHDIEELGDLGQQTKVCPYYSIRKGIEKTEIISLPYQMILQESTRLILNLDITDSIVIIDEAHNVLDVINALHSVSISRAEIELIIKSLKTYLGKFIKRLNSGNRINLMKLIKLCQLLTSFINEKEENVKSGEQIELDALFQGTNADLVNIHKLEAFLNETKIAYKIESYFEKTTEVETSSSNPLLFKIVKFLKCLTNPSKEGRLFWDKGPNGVVSMNYMLLDPSEVFRGIVTKARCVLLCGGTMEPMSDYVNYLFPYVAQSEIKKFSCGHIISKENLKVFPITSYRGLQFDFLFERRLNVNMLENLGEVVLKLCKSIPYGVVAFFPSYKYLDFVIKAWKDSTTKIYERLSNIKTVFQEPKETTSVEGVISEYSGLIHNREGALLLSVVGGKMSEGINFSDDLARGVIMIGLPYPNAYSGEIIAKRNFIESHTLAQGGSRSEATEASRNFYENICMRAVNQSIGRSIRHINDYSSIYLIDYRFEKVQIQNKLSGWVKERIETQHKDVDTLVQQIEEYFNSKLVGKQV